MLSKSFVAASVALAAALTASAQTGKDVEEYSYGHHSGSAKSSC
ncbi:hypothetical protein MY1884_003407 [Beauveria asiatica]